MANTFKNSSATLSTSTDVYVVPAGTTAIVIGCQASNTSSSTAESLSMSFFDSSTTQSYTLASSVSIPASSSYEPIGKMVLEAGDKLVGSSLSSGLTMVVSVLEIS